MRFFYLLVRAWPGLPRLWQRGDATSLLLAISFAAAVNALLLITFSDRFDVHPWLVRTGWLGLSGFWLIVVFRIQVDDSSQARLTLEEEESVESPTDLMQEAQHCYLAGEWEAAESLLDRMLSLDSEDIEARLLLVSVLRRTNRLEAAQSELKRCRKCERAHEWIHELQTEKRWIASMLEDEMPEEELVEDETSEERIEDEDEAGHQLLAGRQTELDRDDFDGDESESELSVDDASKTVAANDDTTSFGDSSLKAA